VVAVVTPRLTPEQRELHDIESVLREALPGDTRLGDTLARAVVDALLAARTAEDAARIGELEKLAYIGDHHFPDLTWKARAEELVTDLRAANARAEQARAEVARLERDWQACREAHDRRMAEVTRLREVLAQVRPTVVGAVDIAAQKAKHMCFAYDVYGLGPHTAATVNPQAVEALAAIDAALEAKEGA
jgi:hypothetical protein